MRLGLSTRKVAEFSRKVAAEQGSSEFSISHARLVQIENEQSIPSIHKLFTLSCVYGVGVQELFAIYFNPHAAPHLHAAMPLPNTHPASYGNREARTIPFPVHLSSTSRTSETDAVSKMNQVWGETPAVLLEHLNRPKTSYGFIGLSDYTMYPLIQPGSVVQMEECRKVAKATPYRTELDRPIYFLQSRSGYLCSWCEINGASLFSIPHPLSPCRLQVFAFPAEVEVIGRVTGVALRLGGAESRCLNAEAVVV
jgi:transcriptional regulator with XRE-family HTH domain